VVSKEDRKNKYFYTSISIIVIALIIIIVILSSNSITEAYVYDKYVSGGWTEDIEDRYYEVKLFGLEKQASFTYRVNNTNYLSYLTVSTIKTLFLMNENELFDKTIETIKTEADNQNIILNTSTKITGTRTLNNSHKTNYVIYEGKEGLEDIMIIGESYNCANSGTSIICIGYSQITYNNTENLENWAKIIRDKDGTFEGIYGSDIFTGKDGLIFNVICH